MRNLIAFLKRFQIFLVFAMLQIIALTIHFTFQNYPRARFMNSAGQITGKAMEFKHAFTKHFNLSEANIRLQEENIELRRQLPMSFIPLQSGMVKINDTLYRQQFEYVPATVLNSTYDKQNNFLTLNVGGFQGVEIGMGVFNGEGAVGYIFEVSEHFCLVKTLLSDNVNLDVFLPNGAFGLLKWNGKSSTEVYITGIANDIDLNVGDEVRTRGTRGLFPRGILVGTVSSFEVVEGDPLWDLRIKLAVDFRKIADAYVIKNLYKAEFDNLEISKE